MTKPLMDYLSDYRIFVNHLALIYHPNTCVRESCRVTAKLWVSNVSMKRADAQPP